MRFKHVLVATATAAMVASAAAFPAMAVATENNSVGEIALAQEATGPQVVLKDVTVDASQLKSNLAQLKNQLKSLMLVSATKDGADITNMVAAGLGDFSSALKSKTPGTYDIPFYYGGSDLVGTAKLTVVDSSTTAAPKLTEEAVVATNGGALLTVMGQGITNEQHALPAGSFSIGDATEKDGAWYTTVTINSSAVSHYFEPLVPAVVQGRVKYDAGNSSLAATFKYDSSAQRWTVDSPARVTFNVSLDKNGTFEFEESVTVSASDVKGLSSNKLIALIKEKLVKKAEVNGKSVVDASGFKVALGAQLSDLRSGKAGSYAISFMYDGDGYNNETVGTATFVVKEEQKTPETPAEPTTPSAPAEDNKGGSAAEDKGGSSTTKTDAKKAAKGEKKLPQTGDGSPIAAVALVAAGAAACSFGLLTKRRNNKH